MKQDDIVFVDTETTGLHPYNDQVWEVAAIHNEVERVWHLPIDVGRISEWVRENTGICERYDLANLTPIDQFLHEFGQFVDGRHMCGNVVSFDAERIGRMYLLNRGGQPVPWHYHLIDVEPLVVGALAARGVTFDLPWDSREISAALGVPTPENLHDALVDARWARDMLICALPEADS